MVAPQGNNVGWWAMRMIESSYNKWATWLLAQVTNTWTIYRALTFCASAMIIRYVQTIVYRYTTKREQRIFIRMLLMICGRKWSLCQTIRVKTIRIWIIKICQETRCRKWRLKHGWWRDWMAVDRWDSAVEKILVCQPRYNTILYWQLIDKQKDITKVKKLIYINRQIAQYKTTTNYKYILQDATTIYNWMIISFQG